MTAADADRAKAAAITGCVREVATDCPFHGTADCGYRFVFCVAHYEDGNPAWDECRWVSVAAALAEARTEARATYDRLTADLRALAEELDREAKRHDDAEPISADGLTRMILAARHCREHAARLRGLVTGNSEEETA